VQRERAEAGRGRIDGDDERVAGVGHRGVDGGAGDRRGDRTAVAQPLVELEPERLVKPDITARSGRHRDQDRRRRVVRIRHRGIAGRRICEITVEDFARRIGTTRRGVVATCRDEQERTAAEPTDLHGTGDGNRCAARFA